MLELRPSCEHCRVALPPASTDARICSFECTFCASCAGLLLNVCPNCGGGFSPRPIRPAKNWKGGNYLGDCPARTEPKLRPVDRDAHARLVEPSVACHPNNVDRHGPTSRLFAVR